ncbi:unnamed protein product [Brassica oleracea]
MGCVFSFLGNQLPVPGRQLLSDHNRFQKTGTDSVYELKETHTGCLVKVDIPGCSEASWWVNSERQQRPVLCGRTPQGSIPRA